MKIDVQQFQMQAGQECDLAKWPTRCTPLYSSKKDYQKSLKHHIHKMSKLQRLLYASNKYSVLVIFQAMDAAGKDGAIRHVMSGINPQGCQVTSFSHPSVKELDHDFMWRSNQALPERGHIGIFNRSYYEEVLIVRVHPEILAKRSMEQDHGQHTSIWQQRFTSILNTEQHLNQSGTKIIKIFLHLSKETQRQRFLKRIDKPSKNWKFSDADINERKYWDQYMLAYQDCLSTTSTDHAPWYVVPADDKKNARLIIANIMHASLQSLDMHYPVSSDQRIAELESFRAKLI